MASAYLGAVSFVLQASGASKLLGFFVELLSLLFQFLEPPLCVQVDRILSQVSLRLCKKRRAG